MASVAMKAKGRFAGVAGGTAGAVAGMVILGPVGALAGSFIGSLSSQVAVHKHEQEQQQQQQSLQSVTEDEGSGDHGSTNESMSNEGFKIGDNIRKVVARGKVASGQDSSSSFRMGDFSRGLSSSLLLLFLAA